MKSVIFRFTLPLTIITFLLLTKWWYGIAIDAKDVFFYGFPFIHKCEGFHTSMSTQYFLVEMVVNFLIYFATWLLITSILYKFIKFKIPKLMSNIFWICFGVLFSLMFYLSFEFDDRYLIKRDFKVEIFDSGFTIFQTNSKERNKYIDELNNWNSHEK